MKYIVYLTTNTKSFYKGQPKIYIGVHKTENPDVFDGYLGCGCWANQPASYKYPKTPIQYAIKKYGPESFKRQILYTYDNIEDAFLKESELVSIDFIKQPHVYNSCIGGFGGYAGKPLYQFDLDGNLLKKWEYAIEAYEFYGISRKQFNYAINDRHELLDSYWSRENKILISDYISSKHGQPRIVYVYNKNGKYVEEFNSETECAEYVGVQKAAISKAIKDNRLVNKEYYITDKLVDEFIPKARKQYAKTLFYIYKDNPITLVGTGIGKQIMPILNCYSWETIRDSIRYKHGWYKDLYISEIELSEIPQKKSNKSIRVDIYDKYGNFIETLDTIKAVRQKYNIPSSKIKNIQLGDKYIGNYIFKYHTKSIVNDIV